MGMSAQSPPPLLRDVIVIPEPSANSDSDFVLKLAEGVDDAERTLADYVIPPSLVTNFDEALSLISMAISSGASRAAYLHGSVGAGKSHFMAVLHASLRGERACSSTCGRSWRTCGSALTGSPCRHGVVRHLLTRLSRAGCR